MKRRNKLFFEKHISPAASEEGIALLMVLWVLTILLVIVMSFSFMARTETYATLAFKGGMEKKFTAEAGIERGIMELYYRNQHKNETVELEGLGVWKTDGTAYKNQFVGGYYIVKITDESGKVDINDTSELVLKNLLLNYGVKAEEADTIVDSVMDWKDADDLIRLHGAESDYYQSLPNPYKAKNSDFDTLEELLLVKGMTPEILYGNSEKRGIIDFLTINAKTNMININAAPKEVLMAIPGMSPDIADGIIAVRQTKEIQSIQDVQEILGSNYTVMSAYISTEGTNTFTIDASGYKENEKGGYTIRATVNLSDISATDLFKYVYYKSPVTSKQ